MARHAPRVRDAHPVALPGAPDGVADRHPDTGAARRERTATLFALGVLVLGVLAIYLPPAILTGNSTLAGMDYWQLHLPRLRYAREALWGSPGRLPAWFTRELLGTPFWSNIDNFPWIPTRFILLLVDPTIAYVVGVNLAALLSASFTYAYCRAVGLGRIAAVSAGWTFAAAGFFAARVLAGYLTLLEAYPALPLLLWRAEVLLAADRGAARTPGALAALAGATTCVALAGHPQLPFYAIVTTILYIVWQRRDGLALRACAAMLLGVGCALYAWWPMLQLIGRSTRVLPLGPPMCDIAIPYGRLAAFVLPWRDGWPEMVDRQPAVAFTGYPDVSYFWDTVCYVGLLPLLAVPFVLTVALRRREAVARPWPFFAVIGLLALVSALPFNQALLSSAHATLLRSPARQLYIITFALALTAGAAIDVLLNGQLLSRRAWRWGIVGLLCAAHAWDLAAHARPLVRTWRRSLPALPPIAKVLTRGVGDGRVAIDYVLFLDLNRAFDDVGFFDAIALARPYQALVDLTQGAPDLNTEVLDGTWLSPRALSFTGTRYVVTKMPHTDLKSLGALGQVHLYEVPDPLPRAAFIAPGDVQFLTEKAMRERLRDPRVDLHSGMMLPLDARTEAAAVPARIASPPNGLEARVAYRRVNPDEMEITVDAPQGGFVRVLEAWDPGWRATLDGVPTPVLLADTFVMALRVEAGHHVVRLRFATPGVAAGVALSLLCAGGLGALLIGGHRGVQVPRGSKRP